MCEVTKAMQDVKTKIEAIIKSNERKTMIAATRNTFQNSHKNPANKEIVNIIIAMIIQDNKNNKNIFSSFVSPIFPPGIFWDKEKEPKLLIYFFNKFIDSKIAYNRSPFSFRLSISKACVEESGRFSSTYRPMERS